LIAAEIRKRRAKDPKFAPGVPDTVDGLHKYFMAGEIAKRRSAEATLARSPGGILGFGAQLSGGAVETFHDPFNLLTLPIGGGGKTLVGVAAREALVNGMLELAQQPVVAHNRAELGEDYTLADAATNVGYAAAGGAVLGTGLHVAGKGFKATSRFVGNVDLANSRAYKIFAALPQRVKDKFGAGIVPKWGKRIADGDTLDDVFSELDNKELADVNRQVVGEGKQTPEETAAANVIERGQEVSEASPFHPSPVGDATHEQGLAQALKDIEDSAEYRRVPYSSTTTVTVNGETRRLDVNVPAAPGEARPAADPGRPRGASTPSGPQPVGDAMLDQFKAKLRHGVESASDTDKNPLSSAQGRYQFTDDTFRRRYKEVFGTDPGAHPATALKNDGAVQEKLMDASNRDYVAQLQKLGETVNEGNLYVEHFLGQTDAARVFKAAPDTPIERILSADVIARNPFLKGKSASQTIAWAHAKMGAAVPSVGARPGFASTLDAAGDDPRVAQLRDEAMKLDDSVIGLTRRLDGSPVNLYSTRVDAGRILVDADRFQFKSGGDAAGVTDRLKGVTEWDPALAGRVMLWEDKAGQMFVADGHQRVGLAKRIGDATPVDAMIFREADGISAEEARTLAALKNVAEGTGSAVDAAKVVRGSDMEALLKRLPPRSALVRDAGALARLSDDAFGAVYNGVVPPDIAAVIGHLLPNNPEQHGALIDLLAKTDPATRGQAESIVRQGIAAGFHHEVQDELFGAREVASSLMLERAKVLEKGLAELKKMRLVHKTAAENKGTLERAGSTIAAEQSAKEAKANEQALEIVHRLAFRSGPIADALNAGARELAGGGKLTAVARAFADHVRELDLAELDRSGLDRGGGDGLDGSGRLGGAGEAEPAVREEPADREQPSLLELEAATERFSDPDGEGVKQQAESLVHDLRAQVTLAFRGIPQGVEDPFKVHERGPLGAGVYLSMNEGVARQYGEELVKASIAGKIFNGREMKAMDPAVIERLLSHMTSEERARFDRFGKPERLYPDDMLERVTRSVEPQRVGEIFKAEGYSAIEANRDGHEFVVFDPKDLSLAAPRAVLHGAATPRALNARELLAQVQPKAAEPQRLSKAEKVDAAVLYLEHKVGRSLTGEEKAAVRDDILADNLKPEDLPDIVSVLDVLHGPEFEKLQQELMARQSAAHAAATAPNDRAPETPVERALRAAEEASYRYDDFVGRERGTLRQKLDAPELPKRGTKAFTEYMAEHDRLWAAKEAADAEHLRLFREDRAAATDPAIADRQRQELALKANSPLRSTAEQDGTMGLDLFARDQLGLELDDEAKSLLDELDADDKAIKAMKDCL
jgi:hypothetical protein